MADETKESSLTSWQVFALLAAAMGAFLHSGVISSSPPSAIEPTEDKGSVLDSHLFEDPYGAWVRAAEREAGGGAYSFPGQVGTSLPGPLIPIEEFRASFLKHDRLCILPVIVRGDFHSTEARELRIRFRTAIVSGLGAGGLVADDPDHLLLIGPPPVWGADMRAGKSYAATLRERVPPDINQPLPIEWFVPGNLPRTDRSPYGAVLVVWVRDNALFVDPMEKLDGLKGDLVAQLHDLTNLNPTQMDCKVIGPYWSGTLADIISEVEAARAKHTEVPGTGTTFYSATATMADGMLDVLAMPGTTKSPVPPSGATGRARLASPGDGPVVVNLTCTDEDFAESFLRELGLRGVKLDDPATRIAIISDWDTDYGRALPLTFAAKLSQFDRLLANASKTDESSLLPVLAPKDFRMLPYDVGNSWPEQVLRAYYISGVGGAAKVQNPGEKTSDAAKNGGDSQDATTLELPEGEHQVDYIARLGDVLADRLRERSGSPGTLRAVGLLGSNVSDELLLMRALRPHFPDAVFFTDKLDARFITRAATPYTRNLIVASSFGEQLTPELQVGVPPFRSSEQAGVFLAVQAAVAPADVDIRGLQQRRRPLRFEIGRTYAVPLSLPSGRPARLAAQPETAGTGKFWGPLSPPIEETFSKEWWGRPGVVGTVALAAVAAASFTATLLFVFLGRFKFAEQGRQYATAAKLGGAAVVVILIFSEVYDGVEPFSGIEGVSLWPSELLRLLAIVTAVGSLLYCERRVKASRERLSVDFGLSRPESKAPFPKGILPFLTSIRSILKEGAQKEEEYLISDAEAEAMVKARATQGQPFKPIRALGELRAQKSSDGTTDGKHWVDSEILWDFLGERTTPYQRNIRAALMTVFYMTGCFALLVMLGFLAVPFRGNFSRLCDGILTIVAGLSMTFLMFWVVAETHACLRFVSKLGSDLPTLWPPRAYYRVPSIAGPHDSPVFGDRRATSAFVDICFIGRLTAEAVPLILLPFIVLTLLVFARWTLFANWHLSGFLLFIYGTDAVVCVACAMLLKKEATEAKLRAVRYMGICIAEAKAAGATDLAKSFACLKEQMETNQEGAFLPWHQQPFVSAILLPFGGGGVLQVIEFLLERK